jgi:N-acetyl-gamma-glutamyl-phosphate reductase
MRVVVIGAAGFVGGELLRILLQHPDVTEVTATSRSRAGQPLGMAHPTLARRTDARFAGLAPGPAARGADVVLLALEHGESAQVMGEVVDAGPGVIVDLAADFRIRDGRLYERYYGRHSAPELVHRFEYGLADLRGTELRGARAIAAPGCFATAAQLALHPLRAAPLLVEPAVYGITGSSGAGVAPKPTTHHPHRAHNVFAYSLLGHRHEAEIQEQWRRWTGRSDATPRLLAHAGPFVRGIYATVHARLREPAGGAVRQAARDRFAGHPFVHLLDAPPEITHVVGTNDALLHVAVTDAGDEVAITVAIDNLVKGAGGQGVQAMNLALGLRETAGLDLLNPFPI